MDIARSSNAKAFRRKSAPRNLPLLTISYYDDKAQLIQSANQNHLGGTDYLTNTYSCVGELLSSQHDHKASPSGPQTSLLTTYTYDHVGRLLITKKKVNAQPEIIQSWYVYNELGQLKEKKVHSEDLGTNFINSIDYAYNERGWTTKIGSPHFTEVLKYNDPAAGAVAQYNGNISEQHWDHGPTSTPSRFTYSYDKLNRLLYGTSTGIVMSETMTYDNMGNIQTLNRDGTTINYAYIGNRLTSLSGGLSGSYTYDKNGNAITDRTGMSFGYNYLNQPKTATKSGTSVNYQYNAMGSKQRKIATAGSTTTQWDYIGGIEYEKVGNGASTIMMIHTEEGFLQNNSGTYTYHYNLTDHLGNVRATLKRNSATTGEIVQNGDYYPFGKRKFIMTSGINHYLYNGKELQDELGGQYDYGARFYDAEIGRWNVTDPMAELHYGRSAYGYVLNNPMLYTDPHGLDTLNYNNMKWGDYRSGEDYIALNEAYVNGSRSTWLWDNQLSSWEQRVAMLSARLGVMQDGLGNLQRQDGDWLKTTANVFSAAGIGGAAKTQIIDFAVRDYAGLNRKSFKQLSNYSKTVSEVRALGSTTVKYLRFSKGLGYFGAGVGVASAGYQLVNNPTAGNATRLAVQGTAIGAAFIPVIGWGVSLSIGAADLIWGDDFYNWIDKH